jgi:hypothetical protein
MSISRACVVVSCSMSCFEVAEDVGAGHVVVAGSCAERAVAVDAVGGAIPLDRADRRAPGHRVVVVAANAAEIRRRISFNSREAQ